MCQLNIYLIKKLYNADDIKVINELFNLIDEKVEKKEDYNVYCEKNIYCNCGSVVSFYNDLDVNFSWDEFKGKENLKEFNRLENIRKILKEKNFKSKQKEVIKTSEILNKEYMKTQINYAEEQDKIINEIEGTNKLTSAEWDKLLIEVVHPKIEKIMLENDKRPERIKAKKKYDEYMLENGIYINAHLYKEDDSEDWNNLNYAIKVLKNNEFNSLEKEYNKFYCDIKNILNEVNEIKVMAFWQDETSFKIYNEKEINFDDMKIEDIVFLKYNTLLTIKK